jgi:hypothetical protein
MKRIKEVAIGKILDCRMVDNGLRITAQVDKKTFNALKNPAKGRRCPTCGQVV